MHHVQHGLFKALAENPKVTPSLPFDHMPVEPDVRVTLVAFSLVYVSMLLAAYLIRARVRSVQVPPTVLVIVTHPIFHVAAAHATPPPAVRTAGSRALSPLSMGGGGGHDHASSSVGSTASCSTALGSRRRWRPP